MAQLTAYRLLMVWVYNRTESLLLAALMHARFILASVPLIIPATTGIPFLTWFIALSVGLWVVVFVFALLRVPLTLAG